MFVRASLAAVAVVVGTLFVVGCAQTPSPTGPSSSASSPSSPSSSASSSVSDGTSSLQITSTFVPLLAQFPCSQQSTSTTRTFPLLAQLNLVDNLLVSANHQLYLFPFPGGALETEMAEAEVGDDGARRFYQEAETKLVDCVAPNYSPLALGTDALNAIIREANITLDLLVNLPPDPPPPPSIPKIIIQAKHIISVATTLINCQKDPCFP